jgi:hypothetical protein
MKREHPRDAKTKSPEGVPLYPGSLRVARRSLEQSVKSVRSRPIDLSFVADAGLGSLMPALRQNDENRV